MGIRASILSADGTKLASAFDDGLAGTPLGSRRSTRVRIRSCGQSPSGQVVEWPLILAYPAATPHWALALPMFVPSTAAGDPSRMSLLGADIWTPSDGFIWIPTGGNQGFVRDITFDPESGDMYVRSSNEVYFADRLGDNTVVTVPTNNNVKLVDNADGAFINNQHLAFLSNTSDGDLIVFNDRSGAGTGQDFFTVNKLVTSAGVAQTMDFSFLPNPDLSPFVPNTGAGWYDYDFDPISQTLALLDTSNQNIHIFQVGSEPGLAGDFNGDGDVDGADFLCGNAVVRLRH